MASTKKKPDEEKNTKKKKADAKTQNTKKSTATKKTDAKKTHSHKNVAEKTQTKKASEKKNTGKKQNQEKKQHHDTKANKEHEHKHTKHTTAHAKHGKDEKKKEKFIQNIIIGIGAIIVILLLGYLIYISATGDNADENSTIDNSTNQQTSELSSDLLVIEDANCEKCQVDAFINSLSEQGLIETSEKVSYENDFGAETINTLNSQQLPIYLFSEKIKETQMWKEDPNFAQAFQSETIDGNTYLVLNPTIIPLEAKQILNVANVEGSAYMGEEDAPITIYELSDFECPYCGIVAGTSPNLADFKKQMPDFQAPIPKIQEEYIEKGIVKKVFYNMPFNGETSYLGGEAALCAFEQDKFKEMYNQLFKEQGSWKTQADLVQYAQDIGLNKEEFETCMQEGKKNIIDQEAAVGSSIGVRGTPTFVITDGENYETLVGAQGYSEFETIIESMIQE